MSDVWFTSDLHIGHAKVAEIRAPRTSFTDDFISNHDTVLSTRWDSLVKKNDVVWVLGDISSGSRRSQMNALKWIAERPGIKHLIAGNHDSCSHIFRNSHNWLPIYLEEAFTTVQNSATRRMSIVGENKTVMLSHFPYRGDHTDEDRYVNYRLRDHGHNYVLHGHTHSETPWVDSEPRQVNVGVDSWNFSPVNLRTIQALLDDKVGV